MLSYDLGAGAFIWVNPGGQNLFYWCPPFKYSVTPFMIQELETSPGEPWQIDHVLVPTCYVFWVTPLKITEPGASPEVNPARYKV